METDVLELDQVRDAMRGLLQYLDIVDRVIYHTGFDDMIVDCQEGQPIYDSS